MAGLWFLFIPGINIIDPLPDFIGFALILYGIYGISNVDYSFSDSARAFKNLVIVELVKVPALYIYFISNDDELLWMMLLTSMIFACLELIFGILAWKNFFSGFNSRAREDNAPEINAGIKKAAVATYVFVIAKPVLCVLPDLSILSSGEYGVVTEAGITSLAQYRWLFNIVAFAVSLVAGIVWLVIMTGFLKKVRRGSEFLAEINESINEYEKNTSRMKVKRLIAALSFLLVGMIFLLEFKIEGYSLVPPFISAALICIYFGLSIRLFGKSAKVGLILSAGYGVFATAGWFTGFLFADRYYTGDDGTGFSSFVSTLISRSYDVFDEFLVIAILNAVAAVCLAATFFMLAKTMKPMISEYCGIQPVDHGPNVSEFVLSHEEKEDAAIKGSLRKLLKPLLTLSVITALSAGAFTMLQVYFGEFFMIDLIIRIIFVAYAAGVVSKFRSAVKSKNGLDYE